MRTLRGRLYLLVILGGAVGTVGCKKEAPPPPETGSADTAAVAPAPATPEAFAISEVTLGKAIDADKRVASPSTTFGPKDTIYASVATTGSASSKTLTAKWTFQDGQTVHEESRDLNLTGDGTTAFQISKPDGFPPGRYKVEISLDGSVVQSKEFEVK